VNILIIGYGKMGREIETLAGEKGHTIGGIASTSAEQGSFLGDPENFDMALEFTGPESGYQNIKDCIEAGVPVVSGTTGWLERLEEIKELVRKKNGSFFYSANFSLGMNLVFHLARILGSSFSNFSDFEAEISETHHLNKKDKPSGTAIKLAEEFLEDNSILSDWNLDKREEGILNIKARRKEGVVGTHKIEFRSELESFSLEHIAKDRRVFASGALNAAEFLINKKGCFSMKDLLGF
jgi:4-hydroxy-tetrahydrodipicolinate reductase